MELNGASESPDTVETPESEAFAASPPSEPAGTFRRMSAWKAALISVVIGLAIAAGVFAGFGLPGTLKPAQSDSRYAVIAAVGEVIHVGLGPFHPSGPREIKILSATLQDPSPAIQASSIRITLFNDPNTVLLGSATGVREDVDALPLALGRVLQPGQDGGFWITFTVNATGDHTFKGLRVTYKSGWLTKTVIVGPNVRARIGEQRGPRDNQTRDRSGSGRTRGTPSPG